MKTGFKNKKAIIFDLDGTLADTIGAITEAVNFTMEHFGYPTRSENDVLNAIGNGATTLIRLLMPKDLSQNDELVLQVRKKYDDMYALTYLNTKETYCGIKETIKVLAFEKKFKLAVFSNKQDIYVKALTEQFFPDGAVSVARGQTELPIKPNISGLQKILEELDVSIEESVFVGDSEVDVKTAENADMDFIGVSWGFSGKERLMASGAQTVIDSPNEMLNILC